MGTLHLTLDTSSLLPWVRFILRWTRLLYFGRCTNICTICTICTTVYLTLDMSSAFRWVHFIIRWTRLLYFGGCTTSYVGHVFSLQVGLKRKEVLAPGALAKRIPIQKTYFVTRWYLSPAEILNVELLKLIT